MDTVVVRCNLCGHTYDVRPDFENLVCSECGYDDFETIIKPEPVVELVPSDKKLLISEEPKDCILYLITQQGETMVITKKSKFSYHNIDRITSDMRLYTYNGALSARDALLKKHPNWRIKVKQFDIK